MALYVFAIYCIPVGILLQCIHDTLLPLTVLFELPYHSGIMCSTNGETGAASAKGTFVIRVRR
jgi:hypothetical protein